MPDIFISFAHVDDQPFANQGKGWITHFVNHLNAELSRRLGRKEYFEFWKDFRLQGNAALTPEIERQVTSASVLLILFSPGWLESKWCQDELAMFCAAHRDIAKRIFVVELEKLERDQKPAVMHDMLNYPFWQQTDQGKLRQLGYPVPQMTDTAYFERLVDLSYELAGTLKSLQVAAPAPEPAKATVYVAPVSDSLYDQRANLISGLRQFGIEALPRNNAMDSNMDAALAKCSHFVQLLDASYAFGIPCNQHFTAEVAKKPIMQWRDPKLDYMRTGIFDDQKKLLEGKTVIAVPLADFIRMVRDAVLPKPPEEELPKPNGKKMVFVHAGQEDFERAYCVAQTLKGKGYGIALPRYQGDAGKIRKSIERGYQFCDVMLMLQQKTSADVVEDYLSEARVEILKRDINPPILICQGDGAEELFFIPPGVLTLLCHNNFDENCLEQFLAEVEA